MKDEKKKWKRQMSAQKYRILRGECNESKWKKKNNLTKRNKWPKNYVTIIGIKKVLNDRREEMGKQLNESSILFA